MSEAIKVEITAEDKASAVIANAAKNAEKAAQQVEQAATKQRQETVKGTKASVEFFGTVANFAGGGAIASMAGQLAGLTEKTGQFAEVAQKGTAATLAMQGGLLLAAGAIAYQVGTAIHNLTNDLQSSLDAMAKLEEQAERTHQKSQRRLQQDLKDRQARIDISGDEQDALKEIDRINKEIALSTEKQSQMRDAANARAEAEAGRQNLLSVGIDYASGGHEATRIQNEADQRERQIAQERERQEVLMAQREELQRSVGIEKELNEERERQSQSLQQATAQEQQYAAVMQDRQQKAEKLQSLHDNELARLQEEVTLLEQGKTAAHALRLERQGMSKEDARSYAEAQEKLDQLKMKEAQTEAATATPELQAKESRLLQFGSDSQDTQKQIAKSAEESRQLQEQQRTLLSELKGLMQKMAEKPGLTVAVAK